MEQIEKPNNNNRKDFDYANFGNELSKPVSKQKQGNLIKETNKDFSASFKNERDRSPPNFDFTPNANLIRKNEGVSSSSRISPHRNASRD